jgi:hypothetical protein
MSNQVDSGQTPQSEVDETQNQQSLQEEGGSEGQQADSLAGVDLADAALNDPVAAEKLRRQFQSDKDRGVARATKTAQEAKNEVEALAQYLGKTVEEIQTAQKNLTLDKIVAERQAQDSGVIGGGQQAPEGQLPASSEPDLDLVGAFTEVGYDINALSPDDYQFASRFQGTQKQLKNALLERKQQSGNQQMTTSSSGPAITSQTLPTPQGNSALQNEYNAKIKAIQESSATGKGEKIAKVKQEFRDKGLDVF